MPASRTTAGIGGAGEHDRLLATKLTVPPTRAERLPRLRLIARLDEGMARDLVLVCTPAGFGKTTLLGDWAQRAEWPVAWLSLDPDDNDPVRFWRYVAAALSRASPGVGQGVLSLLTPPNVGWSQGVVTALINELEALPTELALVLDDYHVIESAPIHEGLSFLVSHLPKPFHLVIASRSDPPLPIARLRARDRLTELRAADLRFTSKESAAFLQEVWGLDVSQEIIRALESRTEGWAVGLQLAALSLQGRPDPGVFVDAFAGTHRYVLDYLSEEVLERQPDQRRNFLLQTSVLERLSGPLCDAVTGESGGQDILEDLERANLFLIPLDEERRWYRLHHLFGDLLRARLQEAEADRIAELHRRASTWCEDHGLIDDAIRHALASGDSVRAGRLVEQHVNEPLRSGEGMVLERWLSLLSDEVVRSSPALCLAQALMLIHVGSPDTVEHLVDHAERAFERAPEPQELEVPTAGGMVAEMPAAIALLRAELAGWRGDVEGLSRFARSALAQMAEHEVGPRLWARVLLADADWINGRLADAEQRLAEVLAEGRAAHELYPELSSCFELGRVQQARGNLGQALRTFRQGLQFATEGGRFLPFNAGESHLGIAQVLYARHELDDALQHATKAVELTREVVEFRMPAFALVALAWIRQAMGDADAALDAINEASRMFPWEDVDSLWYPARTERARLLLAQGRVDEAVGWIEERGLTDEDEISYPRERDYLVLVRALLVQSEADRALGLLERLEDLAEAQAREGSSVEIRALRALALQAAGDRSRALAALGEALSMARPEGYVRVFADEGAPMGALVRSFVGAAQRGRIEPVTGAAREHLNRVIRAFTRAGQGRERAPAVGGLVEPLTERELEVLSLIAAGRRNREIADELVVTLETVKKHVSHIFDKLGAANRTEAVKHARELSLIS
jgi:ATP/maltotriose-dependent transcriptional regulator MalT